MESNNRLNTLNNSGDNSVKEVDLVQIFHLLISKWMIILMVTLAMAAASYGYFHYVVTPQYTSNTRIMVINRQNSDQITATDITSSTSLSKDYVEIVTAPSVLEQVIADLNLDMSVSSLKSMVSASLITDTRMINIAVTNEDPILAKQIADSIATVSSDKISKVMNIKDMVSIIDEGSLPKTPSSPATKRNTIIAALIGIFVSCAVIIVANILNDTIKTADDVEKYLGVSVLGTIPVFESESTAGNKKNKFKKSAAK